jgi:hypothetical protein
MSSKNPIPNNPSPKQLQILYNFTIYSRKRISNRSKPYSTPTSIGNKAISYSWITRVIL